MSKLYITYCLEEEEEKKEEEEEEKEKEEGKKEENEKEEEKHEVVYCLSFRLTHLRGQTAQCL